MNTTVQTIQRFDHPMKIVPLAFAFILTMSAVAYGDDHAPLDLPSNRVDAATAYIFSGKIVFLQKESNVIYDLTVAHGQVSGYQYWPGDDRPVGRIVGGWFDFGEGKLCLLIQGADHVQARLRSQMQQFHLDVGTREVTMEHALYEYGLSTENSKFNTAHVLMVLDRIDGEVEHLLK